MAKLECIHSRLSTRIKLPFLKGIKQSNSTNLKKNLKTAKKIDFFQLYKRDEFILSSSQNSRDKLLSKIVERRSKIFEGRAILE
jgi:hypothetical protein